MLLAAAAADVKGRISEHLPKTLVQHPLVCIPWGPKRPRAHKDPANHAFWNPPRIGPECKILMFMRSLGPLSRLKILFTQNSCNMAPIFIVLLCSLEPCIPGPHPNGSRPHETVSTATPRRVKSKAPKATLPSGVAQQQLQ